jgi:AhpD family alkylhydroperoxidase
MHRIFVGGEGLGYLVEVDGVKVFHAGLHASRNDPDQTDQYRREIDFLKPFGPIAKELIAVGISVQMNCESCMQWHIEQAAASGANMREILEAVEVAMAMGGGPATVAARFALDVMHGLFPDETA